MKLMEADYSTEFERVMEDFIASMSCWISAMTNQRHDKDIEEQCYRAFLEFGSSKINGEG